MDVKESCGYSVSGYVARYVQDSGVNLVIIDIAAGHLIASTQTLRESGVQIWGWQYIRGDRPIEEARFAIRQINHLHLDGIVIRVQEEYKRPGKNLAARSYLQELRLGLPDVPLALSSYSFPSYHPRIPWAEFLAYCDFNMPHFSSSDMEDLRRQISRCQREFREMAPFRPIIPISPVTLKSKEDVSKGLEHGIDEQLEGVWQVIQSYPWQTTQAEKDIVRRYFEALNTKNPDDMAGLYAPRCALVTPSRTIVGEPQIRAWYQHLFTQLLPDVDFLLTDHSDSENSRYFRWIARDHKSVFEPVRETANTRSSRLLSGSIEIFKSVFYKKLVRSTPRQHTAHIIGINLNDSSIDLMVTPPEGLGKTTSDFMIHYGVQLAVNGDEWLNWTNPKGLAVSEGVQYSAPSPEPTVYISRSNRVQVGGTPPTVIWDAISGSHTLVKNGAINLKLRTCAKPEVYCKTLAPRTSLGLTGDNWLILAVVQGAKDSLREALTLKELASLNLELGVRNAISLDGGGSSALAVDDYGVPKVVNTPSEGKERAVSNHLGIRARYLDRENVLRVEDGNDTFGLLDGKIAYHFTSSGIF